MLKKLFSFLLCAGLLVCAVPFSLAAESALKIDGTWTVLIPEDPTSYESYAAKLLSETLSEVFGAQVQTATRASGHYIAVGRASRADVSGVAVNGYRIQAIGGNVHIAGTGVSGVQSGACRFLEEFCGRKVYTWNITVLPHSESVSVPADTDIVYEPFFEYADTDWLSPCYVDYSLANGLNGGTYRHFPEEMGRTVDYIAGFCHTIGGLCETASYAETHPEYLALHDGERTTDQPCLTNPDVLQICIKNVLSVLERSWDPTAALQIVSVTQNDNQNYCECEKCRAFEASHGGVQSATMINFANQVADAVKAAGYDNVAIDTFAYQYTRKAPTGIVPRDNVIVRLCTIECCFVHALDDPDCEQNTALMKDLSDWAAICDRIYVWDYTTDYANTCLFFPDLNVIQRNIQIFYENNVKGVYEEGNYYIRSCNTEFGELRAYMISKALQDPYCDMAAEVKGFLKAYYGPGWQYMQEILDTYLSHIGAEDGHIGIGASPAAVLALTDAEVSKVDMYWKNAYSLARTDLHKENIQRSELSWRFWKGSENKGEFSVLNPERFDEKQKLFEDLQSFGVLQISEGSYNDYLDCLCVRYVPVNEWNQYEADEIGAKTRLFFGKLWESMVPMFSGIMRAMYKLKRLVNGK